MQKYILPDDMSVKNAVHEDSPEFLLKEADRHYTIGNYDKALDNYHRVLTNGAKYPDVYNKIGIILNHIGRHYEAIEAFKNALRLNARYLDAIINLGIVYADLSDEVNAILEFKRALEIDANNTEALFNLRLVTRQDLKGYAQSSNEIEILVDMGKTYYEKGMYRQAIEKFNQILEKKPNYHDIKLLLANVYLQDGFYKEAEQLFKDIIVKKPDWAAAYVNLGTLYYNVKRYKQAVEMWEAAIHNGADADKMKVCINECNFKMKGMSAK